MNSFSEIFYPTEAEIKKYEKQLEGIRNRLLENRDKIKLEKYNENIFSSKPFQPFIGDCESCSHYQDSNKGFVTGGYCKLHSISCGYGFICKDNDNKDNIDWNEFKNILKIK